MVLCGHGLCVGVDIYEHLGGDSTLRAGAGATRIAEVLRAEYPQGTWREVVDSSDVIVRRADVFEAVHHWAAAVGANQCGLLYFGGHGIVTDGELILAARDFRPSVAFDTGIPLNRLVEIIHNQAVAAPGARFVLLLDCCRFGAPTPMRRQIPVSEQMAIVFACKSGQKAAEIGLESAFVSAFVNALRVVPRQVERGRTVVPLAAVVKAASVEMEARSVFQGLEVTGVIDDEMMVAVSGEPSFSISTEASPIAVLESRSLPMASLPAVRGRIIDALRAWLGVEVEALGLISVIADPDASHAFIAVQLPAESVSSPPQQLLKHLLRTCYSVFMSLRISWPRRIKLRSFRTFAQLSDATYLVIDDTSAVLTWPNATAISQVIVDTGEETQVRVNCRTAEGDQLYLDYITTELASFYERLLHLRPED